MKGEKQKKQSKIIHDIIPPTIKKGLVVVEKIEKKISIWTKAFYLFLRTSKYGFALLVFGIALLGGTFIMGFSSKTETTEIYPTQYEGNWQGVKNGLERDLSDKADISEFNFNNSSGIAGFERNKEESSDDNVVLPGETVQVRDTEPTVGNEIDSSVQEGSMQSMEPAGDAEEEIQVEDAGSIKEDIEPAEVESVEELQESSTQSMEPAGDAEEEIQVEDAGSIKEDVEPSEVESVEELQESSTQSMEPAEELSFFEKTKNIFSVPEAKAEEVQVGDAEPTIEAESTSEDVELMVGQEDFTEPIEEDSGIVKGDAESLELIEEVKENDQGEEEIEENNEEKFEDYSGTVIIPDVDGNLLFEIEENKEEEEVQAIFTEEFNAIYSDFSVFQESGELKKIKIGFSFASSGKQNEDDEIIVSWSLNDQNWNIASEFVLDKEYSNKANGGYFYVDIFDLSNLNGNKILEWEDVENIKIKFSYLTNNSKENYVPFFLDAVWLETESEEESGAELEEDDEEIIKKEKIEILSHKKDFKINEELEFKFKYKKEKENLLVSIGETLGIVDYWDGVNLSAEIISSNREVFRISSEESSNFSEIFTLDKDGEISIKFKKPKKFKPGLYKIILKIEEGGEIQIFEQDFTWGVLTINVNKSIYLPGEKAYLQMGVLRDDGHTVCDADLELQIINQELGIETLLSTEDGTIYYSGKCSGNNVTDVPDYFGYYTTGEAGIYEMKLTNLNNGYEIVDSFEVRDSVPFEIERMGPTRIYPPADYEMVLKIKANEDFAGFVQEKIPVSFKIMNQELRIKNQETGEFEIYDGQFITQDENDNIKLLRWHDLNLKQNDELEIKYAFDAPNVSPDLHLLGPLGFYK